MSLTPREAFKFGFLLRCADAGLDADQIDTLVKRAEDGLEKQAAPAGSSFSVLNMLPHVDIAGLLGQAQNLGYGGVAAAAGAGLGAGYGLGRMTEPEADPEEVKKQELIAAYKQQTDRILRNLAARSYRGTTSKPRVPSFS